MQQKYKQHNKIVYAFFLILLLLTLSGCGSKSSPPETPDAMNSSASNTDDTAHAAASSSDNSQTVSDTEVSQGKRDNTPNCLVPSADGITVEGNELAAIDLSHIDCGYFMAQYLGTNNKVKMQVTGPNGITYTYNLGSTFEVFPFAAGSGSYDIGIHENISGTQYATIFNTSIDVTITDEFSPYLYPNQYVNFNENSQVVALAQDLAYPADDDLTVVTNVYNYLISNITYDYDKASTVETGYIPVVDELLTKQKGICFDFASAKDAAKKITEETKELLEAPEELRMEELGDLLFAVVNTARQYGISAEEALAKATDKFIARFEKVENGVIADGKNMQELSLEELDCYWDKVKSAKNS